MSSDEKYYKNLDMHKDTVFYFDNKDYWNGYKKRLDALLDKIHKDVKADPLTLTLEDIDYDICSYIITLVRRIKSHDKDQPVDSLAIYHEEVNDLFRMQRNFAKAHYMPEDDVNNKSEDFSSFSTVSRTYHDLIESCYFIMEGYENAWIHEKERREAKEKERE